MSETGRALRVLLSNDDGWDAPGITALRQRFIDEGIEVFEVAPSQNRSGASMFTTTTGLSVTRPLGPQVKVWAVDGTPVDAVTLALGGLLRKQPDVVVSGVNSGANVGLNVNYSGTVGVAAAATELGVPAIAVSAAVGPGGEVDFAASSEVALRLVQALAAAGFPGTSDSHFVNVNVPYRDADTARLQLTDVSEAAPSRTVYSRSADGTWTPTDTYDETAGEADDDVRRLASGAITVSVLDTARNVGGVERDPELLSVLRSAGSARDGAR